MAFFMDAIRRSAVKLQEFNLPGTRDQSQSPFAKYGWDAA
jgi:hypothetical protein